MPIRSEVREYEEKVPEYARTPLIEGDHNLDFEFEIKEQEIFDRINPSNFDFQQVVTPCPILYQNFTPTFLNTPHAMPSFLCNFGNNKNDNLFL